MDRNDHRAEHYYIKQHPFPFITEDIRKLILPWHKSERELNIPRARATKWARKRVGREEAWIVWTCSMKYAVS